MSTPAGQPSESSAPATDASVLEHARRDKLRRWREEFGLNPYGSRVEGLMPLAQARALFDQQAHDEHVVSQQAAKGQPESTVIDRRPRALVAGRCIQHRAMGKLVFIVLRDHTGDLQISISRAAVDATSFKVAEKLDYGDIVVAGGPIGATQKGEICVWADRFEVHCKSLAPPPEKFHGLADPELRYRQRYVDMYATPETMRVFQRRSRLVSQVRRFMEQRGFLEVETPMMQPIAGGAAARPFITHHNALDIDLFLRVAPELYLKRLLVGGLPRVYEINRNFRNEGIDRTHNPEFTMMEVYEAFGDCWTMLELTESLCHELAHTVAAEPGGGAASADRPTLPFGEVTVDWSRPFVRRAYGEIFESALGFSMFDREQVKRRAREARVENVDKLDHWLLVSELFDRFAEPTIDPARPTFVTDFPAAISPLTRPHMDNPELAYRWELFVAGAEIANSYTELNDPDIQLQKFTEQLAGADEEARTFRTLDHDFIHALKVGMPPAGGMGLGIDRVIMLMTNCTSIRDVILFPLLRPEG
ncbi:MAG: lysine--tRNA ligase [Phycisphaeraceae bacterium]|nr:MAG: lysine--tRNA ligase [Phycisphaeraceae bacterium]